MRQGFVAFAVAAITVAAPLAAAAQEKTPANAFAFIRDNVGDRSWEGQYELCEEDDYCQVEWARVVGVSYLGNTYCHLRFVIAGEGSNGNVVRDVDLTKSFSIVGASTVWFSGPVRKNNGDVTAEWQLRAPSWDIGTRTVAAINYLQTVCKPAGSPW
jgi:hypothetical protein